MKPKSWWIKERHNPQLGVYYTGLGNLSVKEALKHESTLYGDNLLHRFKSRKDYEERLIQLNSKSLDPVTDL